MLQQNIFSLITSFKIDMMLNYELVDFLVWNKIKL